METPLLPVEPAVRKNNPLALWAGILGLGSIGAALLGLLLNLLLPGIGIIICCGLALLMNLVALVLGIIGLVQLKSRPEQTGKGWAITGIVFGGLSILLICLSPILGTAILALLGPTIGNVFSEVNNGLVP
jgi:hypothetical protein